MFNPNRFFLWLLNGGGRGRRYNYLPPRSKILR